ncbi:TetR family transcriptional regulator [Streptomyces albus subsp. albus]|nr:TetR family transcriptional regulator [Streptomyces albus subsp. albus]
MAPARSTASAAEPATPPVPPATGLRERKKIRTRQAIRRAAFRLFEEQGYDATPIDRIAAAADVSPSTVFRYFPTKEDIVLSDEYDPMVLQAMRARPLEEPLVETLRHAIVDVMRHLVGQEHEELLTRLRLIRGTPAIRARMSEGMGRTGEMLRAVIAERTGRDQDDLEVRVAVAATLAAMQEAVFHTVDRGLDAYEDAVDQALGVLARGLTL